MVSKDQYYIYILRCLDNSLYTGIAKDYEARYSKHLQGEGAKYTRVRKPKKLERVWLCEGGRSESSKVEYFIKKKEKRKKEEIVKIPEILIGQVIEKLGIKIIVIK